VEYLQPAAREKEQYRDLLRARNRVARLMRHLLFKRLESSVEAFRATLGVLVRSNANFRAALEAGYVPIGQTAATMLAGTQFNADDLLHRLDAEEARRKATGAKKSTLLHPAADFDTARWLADLDRDHAILAELQRAVARIAPDEVAAHQRGIALLQNIQQQDPALWRVVMELPDGIRAALAAPEPPTVEQTLIDFQLSFERPAQLPLTVPVQEAGVRSPLDAPGRDETVALLKEGDRPLAYAVGSDLQPRPLTSSQLLAAMECAPATPPRPLPADTNKRVMAAYAAARHDAATRIGRARRPSTDTRLRRYLARELKLLREAAGIDPEELKRGGALHQIFLGHLPANVLAELNEARRMETTGPAFARRLEAIRERYRLNPPEANGGQSTEVGVMRIVCSDGLV